MNQSKRRTSPLVYKFSPIPNKDNAPKSRPFCEGLDDNDSSTLFSLPVKDPRSPRAAMVSPLHLKKSPSLPAVLDAKSILDSPPDFALGHTKRRAKSVDFLSDSINNKQLQPKSSKTSKSKSNRDRDRALFPILENPTKPPSRTRHLSNYYRTTQISVILVKQDGISQFNRSVSVDSTLNEICNTLDAEIPNPNFIVNEMWINGNTSIKQLRLRRNESVILYDNASNDNKQRTNSLNAQTVIYQSITAYPQILARFVIELGKINRINFDKKSWQEILPCNQFGGILQTFYEQRSNDNSDDGEYKDGEQKDDDYLIQIYSPFHHHKTMIQINSNETLKTLKEEIKQKQRFQCDNLLLFAAKQKPPQNDDDEKMHGNDGEFVIRDFMTNPVSGNDVEDTLNKYWLYSELKQTLQDNLKKYLNKNVQFFQLRNNQNYEKLSTFPLYFDDEMNLETFIYAIPLSSKPLMMNENKGEKEEIYNWCVGKETAQQLWDVNQDAFTVIVHDQLHDDINGDNNDNDNDNGIELYIPYNMTVTEFIKQYKYKQEVDVFVYNPTSKQIEALPLPIRSVLYHSMISGQAKLEIVIKKQDPNLWKQSEPVHPTQAGLLQSHSDKINYLKPKEPEKKRARSATIMSRSNKRFKKQFRKHSTGPMKYDPNAVYGGGIPINESTLNQFFHLKTNKKTKRRKSRSKIRLNFVKKSPKIANKTNN